MEEVALYSGIRRYIIIIMMNNLRNVFGYKIRRGCNRCGEEMEQIEIKYI